MHEPATDPPVRTGKSSPKIKLLCRIVLGHQGPRRRDIPDPGPGMSWTRTLCKAPFSGALSVVLDRKWPGCPAIWVGTSRDLGLPTWGLSLVANSLAAKYPVAGSNWARWLAPSVLRCVHQGIATKAGSNSPVAAIGPNCPVAATGAPTVHLVICDAMHIPYVLRQFAGPVSPKGSDALTEEDLVVQVPSLFSNE